MVTNGRQAATVVALVAGGVMIGAGLGLLFAPQPGSETRRKVLDYAKRVRSEAAQLGQRVRATVNRTVESGKSLLAKRDNNHATDRQPLEVA